MPRITLTLLLGTVIFLISAGVWIWPVLMQDPPPGAIADWTVERVRARLDGVVLWLILGAFVAAAVVVARGWLPGMRRR
ncbi:MAG: hypothetical protein ACE5IL_16870 [Myxococcota bacterium]